MRRIFPKFRRFLAIAAALIGLGQPATVRAAAAWEANSDDALLFDVRLGKWRLGDGVRGYQTPQGACIDFADMIMALDLPVRLDKKLRRATGWAFEERRSILIDREANTVQIMNKKTNLTAGMIYDAPEGWCVNVTALSAWLGVSLEADTGGALLFIKSDAKLPVELAIERRERAAKIRPIAQFDLKSMPQARFPMAGVKVPSVDAVVTLGGQRDSVGKGRADVQYEFYASGEIGPVAYDARLASNRHGIPESLRMRAYRIDPEGRIFGDFLPVTQVAAGDVIGFATALVSQSSIGRGAMITNRPIDRPDNFDRMDFRGELPVGWDAELYRNGQLLSFAADRADGRYQFLEVPLLYGQNRFEIVLYGPQGQVKRETRTIMVGADSIPPRQTWYWAGINQEGRDLLTIGHPDRTGSGQWRGSIGLERGLNARTSVQLSAHSIYLTEVGRRNFIEGSIRRAIGPTLVDVSASLDDHGGKAFRAHMLGQLAGTSVTAESIILSGGYRSDRISSGVTGLHSLSLDRHFSFGRTILPLHLDMRYITRGSGESSWNIRSRTSANFGRFSLTGEVEWRRENVPVGPRPPDSIETTLLGNARIGRVRLRGEARFSLAPDRRFRSAALVGEWSGSGDEFSAPNFRAELGYEHERHVARAGLGYIRKFKKFAVTASAEAASDGALAAGLSFSFSLGPDPRRPGRVRMTSSHLASEGQILARVYRDVNGDGHRQSDEPLEKDVQIAAGTTPVRDLTDANGFTILDGLAPFNPVLIGIDAGSIPDPLVQPSTPGIVVTPRPGVIAIVELPLVGAGEVDGTLVRSGGTGLEGIELELVTASGQVVRRTLSDFDGYFLFESVPYGKYKLRVGKTAAEVARVVATLPQSALIDGKTPSIHLGIVAAEALGPRMAAAP
jgi:Carboxypeptidase regulatory-like domain